MTTDLAKREMLKRARAVPATNFVQDREAARILDALTRAVHILLDVSSGDASYKAAMSVILNARTFSLVNDENHPGPFRQYGTDERGDRHWLKRQDSEMSIVRSSETDRFKLAGDEESVDGDQFYGAKQGHKGWYPINLDFVESFNASFLFTLDPDRKGGILSSGEFRLGGVAQAITGFPAGMHIVPDPGTWCYYIEINVATGAAAWTRDTSAPNGTDNIEIRPILDLTCNADGIITTYKCRHLTDIHLTLMP